MARKSTKTCLACEKEFEAKHGNSRYCLEHKKKKPSKQPAMVTSGWTDDATGAKENISDRIIEAAERIVILYANYTGHDSERRAEFRGDVLSVLVKAFDTKAISDKWDSPDSRTHSLTKAEFTAHEQGIEVGRKAAMLDTPPGVSQWREQGKRFGYFKYFGINPNQPVWSHVKGWFRG